jgi:hypothetical protein
MLLALPSGNATLIQFVLFACGPITVRRSYPADRGQNGPLRDFASQRHSFAPTNAPQSSGGVLIQCWRGAGASGVQDGRIRFVVGRAWCRDAA